MKTLRFLGPCVIFSLAAFMIVYAAAQAAPSPRANHQSVQANQPDASGDAQVQTVSPRVSQPTQAGMAKFSKAVTYNSGGYIGSTEPVMSTAVADLNGDGRLDIVVTNQCLAGGCDFTSDGEVSVLLGNGDGTFQTAVSYDTGGIGAVAVAIKDVNRDGLPDLVVASQCPHTGSCVADGEVSVLLGNGDGTFRPAVVYDSGGFGPTSVAIGDFNGDGYPDLAVTNVGCVGDGCLYQFARDGREYSSGKWRRNLSTSRYL